MTSPVRHHFVDRLRITEFVYREVKREREIVTYTVSGRYAGRVYQERVEVTDLFHRLSTIPLSDTLLRHLASSIATLLDKEDARERDAL